MSSCIGLGVTGARKTPPRPPIIAGAWTKTVVAVGESPVAQPAGIASARSARSGDLSAAVTAASPRSALSDAQGRTALSNATARCSGDGKILQAAEGLADAMMSAANMLKERQQRARQDRRSNSRDCNRGASPLRLAGAAATGHNTTRSDSSRRGRARSTDLFSSTASSAASSVSTASSRAPPRPRLGKPGLKAIENPGLKMVADQCSALTSRMQQHNGREERTGCNGPLSTMKACEVWAKCFVCGSLTTRGNSKVQCFEDRLEYTIHGHPQEDVVRMVMEFEHIVEPKINRREMSFQFRLEKELQYFSRFYNPKVPSHILAVGFSSAADFETFERYVRPKLTPDAASNEACQ